MSGQSGRERPHSKGYRASGVPWWNAICHRSARFTQIDDRNDDPQWIAFAPRITPEGRRE